MNANILNSQIASKAIPFHQFIDQAQMMRWRRLVTKYFYSPLIENGEEIDFIRAALVFVALDPVNCSLISKAACHENLFMCFHK